MTPAPITRNRRRGCGRCWRRWSRPNPPGSSAARRPRRRSKTSPGCIRARLSSACSRRCRRPATSRSTPIRSCRRRRDKPRCARPAPSPRRAMGFCLFNNIAVGALRAREVHGLARVAAIDFDVHHGNGTQARFADDPTLFYASTHQSPLYPGTGAASETGVGNIVNAPLPPLAGSRQFRMAMSQKILPALDAFRPEMVLISAGFDAHRDDPLAQLLLEEGDYAWATEQLLDMARRHAGGRVVATLEGGYDLPALAASAAAHVRALMSV